MSNAVATVAFLEGQAWAKAPDGSLRPLSVGSTLNADEVLVTAQGAQVQLDFGNGEPVLVNGGLEVAMSRDFSNDTATTSDEAALNDASVQEALTVLEQGGDLLDELEETAAGEAGGGGADATHDFVQLTRVIEQTDPQSFAYQTSGTTNAAAGQTDGNDAGYINRAPQVTDQTLTGNEDEVIRGQVIASDIEGDNITYSLATPAAHGAVVLDPVTGQFTFTPAANYNGSDSFVVTVTDSHGNTSITTISLDITAVNDAPTANDINLTTDEDTPVAGQVVAQDIEGDTLTYSISGQPANGSVTLDPATGSFVYTPNTDYNGSDSFVVTVSDGNGGVTTSIVRVGITPVNDAPVSNGQNLVTDEDTPINGQVVATDIDGDTLSYTLSGQPANGIVSINPATGGFVYTPNANYNGSDGFVVTISDGNGGTTTSRINIGITPVNDAPVAGNLNLTTPEDTPVTGQVSATDVDGDTLGYVITGLPANGSVSINPATGNFTYTPNANYHGSDSFVVTVSDGKGGTVTSVVTIGVTPVNDAPVTGNQNLTTDENVPLNGAISATDIDGDTLSFSLSGSPVHGTLVLNGATGTFTYTPNAGYNGSDSFVVIVSDGNGGTTTSTVNIGINAINHAPTAGDDIVTTDENTAVVVAVRANDIDPDGDSLSVSGVTQGTNGLVVIDSVTGNLIYTPNPGFVGTDHFTYTIDDNHGGTDTALVTVTVNAVVPINHVPVAYTDSITVAEGGSISSLTSGALSVLANDTDADGDSLVAVLVAGPFNGSLVLYPDGTFNYTHDGSESTFDSFTYKVNDGTVDGNTVTVHITVTPVNDAPIANDDIASVNEGSSVVIAVRDNDTDAEGSSLTVTGVTQGANGSVLIDTVTGNLVYTPNAGFSGHDSFTYTIEDSGGKTATATVTVNVTAAPNIAPETDAVTVNGTEDSLVTVNLSGSDADGSVVGYVIKSLPANGVLYADAAMAIPVAVGSLVSGPVYFMPNADWNGTAGFSYAARDDQGTEDPTPATVTINLADVPDAALIGGATSGSVKEDTPAQTSVSGILTITDADDGQAAFTAKAGSPGTYGSFSIDADGHWTYVLDNSNPAVQALKEGETRFDSFSVTSIDGTLATVTITVKGTNDGPVAAADTATVNQDAVLTLTPAELLGNDSDDDGDTLSISSVQDAANGTVDIVGGNVVFTPTPGYHGPASFTYTISDGQVSATATVDVTVVKPNTPPVAVNDAAASTGANNIGLFSEYFGYREPADGLNLTKVEQVYSFINGRTPDATFIAKTFDYTAGTFVNGLGYGTNLQTFLGSDAASLSADPATTSDAIIRMRGFVNLEPGSYNFKILADDGYQIRIDGVVVAEVNRNQPLTLATHAPFTISTGGLHHIEIIYWDQGQVAKLKLELSDDAGTTYDILSSIPSYQQVVFSAVEDTTLSIPTASLLANDTDADNDTLTIQSVQDAINGTVNLVGGNVVFNPAANYSGPASFTYTISDGKGGTATATVNLVVVPVNDGPVAANDSVTTKQSTAISIPLTTLLANDSDLENDYLSLVSVQESVNGTAVISGSNVMFTPTANYEGPASFTYTIRDPAGATSKATVNVTVGSATAASLVVAKSLLAVAHGTGGTSVKFPIITKLVDTDGSESLTIKVSNVPTGLSFNAGINLGGGVWQFTEADLPNLTLNLPGSYTTNATHFNVQVIATEINGGATASTSSAITLKAAYTTVDITTTESGSYTGSSANEYIQGGNGNNVINGANGNNIIYGGAGDDNLSAGVGSDVIYGGSGNDTINAGSGTDRISGGSGNDVLIGGDAGENFVDVFVWSLGDQGSTVTPAVDTIQNFATAAAGTSASGGDVLDLRDLLQNESVGPSNSAGNLANYLHFEVSGSNTIIHVSHTGGFNADSHSVGGSYTSSAETQKIVLEGVNLQSAYAGATTDQQIITQLLNNNKLITD